MFFRLNPEARLISGAKNGVVYDFLDNRVYDVNSEEKSVLELSEKSEEIDTISSYLGVSEASVIKTLEKFREKTLGEFYEKKPYIEPLHLKSPLSNGAFYEPPPQLTNFFVELNNSCHYNCSYCSKNKMKRVFGCIGCNVWDDQKKALDSDLYRDVLDQAYKLGFQQIFLTGGNVLEDLTMLSAVLDHCGTLHFPAVFVTFHEKQVSENSIDFLNCYEDLNVFLSCDFPISSRILKIADTVHQNLTVMPVVAATEIKSKKDVIKKIQNEYEKVKSINSTIGWQIDYCSPDFLHDYTKIPLFGKERVTDAQATLHFFEWCQEHHPCLGGILTVSSCGNVYGCRMMRKKSFGNVLEADLSEIMRTKKEEIQDMWNLTRDKITPCNQCEYRYSCMDCRAIEKDMHQTSLCAYDPQEGKWHDDLF
ncbi:MAG: hypothetical protein AYK19_03670 [Theionarchaea archaeon DG-70-1]|nr:MAG: hypothetical protein AYK19_03670 [Theionarchaea archaeon DG-70-1]